MCLAVANGGHALGKIRVGKGRALYVGLEDTLRRLQDRQAKILQGEKVSLDLVEVAVKWPRFDGQSAGLAQLDAWLIAHDDARLVVLDTFRKIRPAGHVNNGGVADAEDAIMTNIQKVANAHGVAIVVVHHLRKMAAEDPFDTVAGTLAMTGAADTTLILQRKRGSLKGQLHVTGRDVDETTLPMVWRPTFWSWDLAGTDDEAAADAEPESVKDRILAELGDAKGMMTAKELAGLTGAAGGTVRKVLTRLKDDGVVRKGRGGYCLADDYTISGSEDD